jgi:hypothetical protein
MTTTTTKLSTYYVTVPVTTYLSGQITAPAGLAKTDVIKLINGANAEQFEPDLSQLQEDVPLAIENAEAYNVSIEEEPND